MTERQEIIAILKDNNICLQGNCHLCKVTKRCDVLYKRFGKDIIASDDIWEKENEYEKWVEYKRNGLTKYFIKMWGEDKLVEALL